MIQLSQNTKRSDDGKPAYLLAPCGIEISHLGIRFPPIPIVVQLKAQTQANKRPQILQHRARLLRENDQSKSIIDVNSRVDLDVQSRDGSNLEGTDGRTEGDGMTAKRREGGEQTRVPNEEGREGTRRGRKIRCSRRSLNPSHPWA